jgi:hypothetical protein
MMRGAIAALLLGTFPAIGTALAATPGGPELSRCPALEPLDEPLNDRTKPLPVPRRHAMLIASSRDRLAVATIYGGTVCIDSRAMTSLSGFAISDDRRFFAFDWTGYEADGHIVVDRTGKGQIIETGVSPVISPSQRRFAAVQQSEAAFGGLEGLGVWQIDVVGVRPLTLQEDIPSLADWRIDGWAGDDCIDLSGISPDRMTSPRATRVKLLRDRYVATLVGKGWALTRTTTGCPKPAKRK